MDDSGHVAVLIVKQKIRAGDVITYDTQTRQCSVTHRPPWYRRLFRGS